MVLTLGSCRNSVYILNQVFAIFTFYAIPVLRFGGGGPVKARL